MSTGVDGAAGALGASDRPVLLKGPGSLDGGRVGAGAHVDVVDGAVDVDLAFFGCAGGGVVGAEVLDYVVLYKRAASPAVDGEVAVPIGIVGTRVVDSSADVSVKGLTRQLESYLAAPVLQPFPPTKFPLPFHWTLNWPPFWLV